MLLNQALPDWWMEIWSLVLSFSVYRIVAPIFLNQKVRLIELLVHWAKGTTGVNRRNSNIEVLICLN